MEQKIFLKKELQQEVLKLIVPLTIGILGLGLITFSTSIQVIMIGIILCGSGMGITIAQIPEFFGSFFPYYLALRK